MNQSPDCKHLSIDEILEILRSQADSLPRSATSSRYLSALSSLESSIRAQIGLSSDAPLVAQKTEDLRLKTSLTDWLINQWLMNIPFSTASLYLDIISALYGSAVKSGRLPKTDLFSHIKAQLKTLGPQGWKSGIDHEIFARALRLTKNSSRLISDDAIAADLLLLSLTTGLQPLEKLAMLRREDLVETLAPCVCSQSQDRSRRKYLFPLDQYRRTESQLKKHIAGILNALFRRAALPQATDPMQTVEALWAYAALLSGIPASHLVAYLGHAPLGLPVLKLSVMGGWFPNSPVPSGDRAACEDSGLKTEDLAAIGRVFLDNPPRWYALSLRPGVRFTQVCRRLALLQRTEDSRLRTEDIKLFYPCEEIARAIGRKIVIRQRPFIHSVVFFRARLTDIGPLFARIGDLAWCYRQSARPGAPYAEISDNQFRLFQQTIARFTPDYEVASTGELELRPNDRVRIVGGLFAGREATFDSVMEGGHPDLQTGGLSAQPSGSEDSRLKTEDSNASGVVYRLNIIGDNGIEWRIHVDPRLTAPKE